MKKLFALTLAVAMVLSMASVAFAANTRYAIEILDDLLLKIDDHEYTIVGDNDVTDDNEELVEAIYGDTLYIPVWADEFDPNAEDASVMAVNPNTAHFDDVVKNFKIKADWSKNGSLVEDVKFVKAIVNHHRPNDDVLTAIEYLIAIDTKAMPEAVDAEDVIGTITVDPKSKNIATSINSNPKEIVPGEEYKFDVAFTLNYKDAPSVEETADDDFVYDFKARNAEDEEHEIELFAGMGRFVVNTIGQGKLAINTNVEYNEGVENVAPDANYVYFNSNNPTFNRLGDLLLTAEEDNHIYKVKGDGSLEEISPKYDEDEEAFVIRTRVIGSYVIAEEELPEEALVAGVEKVEPEAPVAPVAPSNPSTGAAC